MNCKDVMAPNFEGLRNNQIIQHYLRERTAKPRKPLRE